MPEPKTAPEAAIETPGFDRPGWARDLFPLPLAPFEWLHYLDDSPEYPATFFGEINFEGEAIRAALEGAWSRALARHPLLMARIDGSPSNPCWIAEETVIPQFDFQPLGVPVVPRPAMQIDLRSEPGVRLWARCGANQTRLLFQFHHACCDGAGAMRFIADLLLAYAAEATLAGSPPRFDPLDRELLRHRAVFLPSATRASWRGLGVKLQEAYAFHTCRPQLFEPLRKLPLPVGESWGVGAPRGSDAENLAFPGTATCRLSVAQSRAVQVAVGRSGGTLNDAAIALAFQTILAWNDRHSPGRSADWLRMIVPTDLRSRSDRRLPAANRLSLCFIARRLADCRNPDLLLSGVQREMRRVKRTRLGLDLLHTLAGLQSVPTLARALLLRRRSLATAILTNMSDPTRCFRGKFPQRQGRLVIGNLTLESITGGATIRAGTRLGLGVGKYAGRLILNARCDPHWFTARDAAQILDEYATAWIRWSAAMASPRRPMNPREPIVAIQTCSLARH